MSDIFTVTMVRAECGEVTRAVAELRTTSRTRLLDPEWC